MKKRIQCLWILFCCLCSSAVQAQEYNGLTGLLQVPNACTDSVGTFRGNFMFLHQAFIPDQMPDKNTMSYTVGITPFRWLELSYGAALLWMHKNAKKDQPMGYYNEDRRVNVKVTPLYEGKWWPAIALGMDDVGRFNKFFNGGAGGNNYFQNVYIALSKHFDISGHQIGAHLAYRYYSSKTNADRRGIAGGITYSPYLGEQLQGPRAWIQRPRVVVEWDGIGVNAGVDVLLWRHLFIEAALVHGRGFTGGLGYHHRIRY